MRNALVALGGGPSPVINASLLGVYEACRSWPDRVGKIYAAVHGVEGLLKEELIDLTKTDEAELKKLRFTPSSGAIGTCRYKLHADMEEAREDYARILDVVKAHDIGYFYYIGGNDSMDTAFKVSELAHKEGIDLTVAGVPKTIDNDLGDEECTLIDHSPGYGSTARYWAMLIRDMAEENRGMCVSENVLILQAMGRKAGFITAASRLADKKREIPLQMYFAETGMDLEILYTNVCRMLKDVGRAIVVVNEGFDVGDIGAKRDGFGHIEYGASETTAANAVANYLNSHPLPVRGQATWQVPGVIQRSMSAYRSKVDEDEAYEAGRQAVRISMEEGTGYMATILRESGAVYKARYDKVPLDIIAGSARFMPKDWISKDGLDVTDKFFEYALPLIGEAPAEVPFKEGFQDFAKIKWELESPKLPKYIPLNFR
jgi:6-phosphofructokinase 1